MQETAGCNIDAYRLCYVMVTDTWRKGREAVNRPNQRRSYFTKPCSSMHGRHSGHSFTWLSSKPYTGWMCISKLQCTFRCAGQLDTSTSYYILLLSESVTVKLYCYCTPLLSHSMGPQFLVITLLTCCADFLEHPKQSLKCGYDSFLQSMSLIFGFSCFCWSHCLSWQKGLAWQSWIQTKLP